MTLQAFVTAIIAGVVNIACLCVTFFLHDDNLVKFIQAIGEGLTVIAVAIIVYCNSKSKSQIRSLQAKLGE
jgi:hypothetical protein